MMMMTYTSQDNRTGDGRVKQHCCHDVKATVRSLCIVGLYELSALQNRGLLLCRRNSALSLHRCRATEYLLLLLTV